MKKFTVLTLTMFFALAFAAAASAQVPAAGGIKIAVINTQAFREETGGITKYVNAVKSVNAEFAAIQTELQTLTTRAKTLETEIKALQQRSSNDPNLAKKVDEYDKLQRDYKFKAEDATSRYNRRLTTATSPISQAIGNALQEFGKQKGYAIIFDITKDTTGLILAIPDEKVDITKDFIAFYNAKP
ncbi:MAG: OmpH family outer membrane protein [Pyrinomonadaceae bacterium]|nr:OmpH family outer membrane protein [Pyrinomonadaceae bacterium]